METRIFKTASLSEKILGNCRIDAAEFQRRFGRKPCLAVVLVGDDPASAIYVKKKGEACRAVGIQALDFRLSPKENFARLEEIVDELNHRDDVDGILVQSPLPKGWDERAIQAAILPEKDVDGFHPENAGRLLIDATNELKEGLPPCTPAGVMAILSDAGISVAGKNAVVIGRSTIVGKPMAMMLLAANATVTICHSRTENLPAVCAQADILISAIGKPKFVTADFVKPGATLIDVGINRIESEGKSRVVGDIDAESVTGRAGFLTPVPGGVGPMTITILLQNTIRAALKRTSGDAGQ